MSPKTFQRPDDFRVSLKQREFVQGQVGAGSGESSLLSLLLSQIWYFPFRRKREVCSSLN